MGFLYLVYSSDTDYYKIGITSNYNKRKKQLQTGNPNELVLENLFGSKYYKKIEQMLHNHYSHKNKLNEWFQLDYKDVKNFIKTCKTFEEAIKALEDNEFFNKKKKKLN